jgi:hypothetical protein
MAGMGTWVWAGAFGRQEATINWMTEFASLAAIEQGLPWQNHPSKVQEQNHTDITLRSVSYLNVWC